MHIPLVDLRAQYQAIKQEAMASFEEVLEHTKLFLGPQSLAFEIVRAIQKVYVSESSGFRVGV
jgi:hypothetical protein